MISDKFVSRIRTSSVPTPSLDAANIMLYCDQLNSNLPSLLELCPTHNIQDNTIRPDLLLFIKLLFMYSLRFTELFSAKIDQIIDNNRLIILGAKRSSSIMIILSGLDQFKTQLKNAKCSYIFQFITYPLVRNICKKLNDNNFRNGKKYTTCSHLGRKIIDSITKSQLSERSLSDVLHQKSKSSSRYYRSKQYYKIRNIK